MRLVAAAAVMAGAVAVAVAVALAAAAPDPGYELRLPDAVDAAAGAAGAVSLTVAPSGGRTISTDGVLRVDLAAGDGLALPRRRLLRRDAADPAADAPRFDLRFKAAAVGEHPLTVDVRFWLCGKRLCRPVHATRTVTVRVAAPDAGVPPPP